MRPELGLVVACLLLAVASLALAARLSNADSGAAATVPDLDAAGAAAWPEQLMAVVFLSVQQGDATYIRTPGGRHILIDGGQASGEHHSYDAGHQTVVPFLRQLGVERLAAVIMTHAHHDHVGGLLAVLEEIPVTEVIEPGLDFTSGTYERFLRLVESKDVRYRIARAGDELEWGDELSVRVLNPPERLFSRTRSEPNDNSVVIALRYGDVRFLLPGDIERAAEDSLLRFGPALQAQILKVPHHGSEFSSTPAFLSQVRPEVAVISCGRNNKHGHPSPETLRRYRERGAEIVRTDFNGSITILTDGRTYRVIPEHS